MKTQHEVQATLPLPAIAAALLISAIWGFNFVVIKVGVAALPPLSLAALRFVFSALPLVFFVKKPAAPLALVAAYGLFLGVGEFGLLFTAIRLGAPAGLSSILLQSQAFFTAIIAALFLGERIRAHNIAGMLVASLGLGCLALSSGVGGLGLLSFAMIILAALAWAVANVLARKMPGGDALSLMAWSSLFSPLPLALLSLLFEGPAAIEKALASLSLLTIGALAYLVLLSTLLGYGLWNHLIMRHGAGRIAPFSLLVPIFGMSSALLVLGEEIETAQALGGALVILGLLLHVFGGRFFGARRGPASGQGGNSGTGS